MTAAAAQPKRRLSRDDWIAAALDAIARGGLAAVAIEPLAALLGVTKGSFYSHFSTRDELIEAALESWETTQGGTQLERFAQLQDPAERLHEVLLTAVSFSQSGTPSVHVSLLGELGDKRARAAVARVNQARLRLLIHTYRQLGFPPQRANYRARLAYASYLGLLEMAHEAPDLRTGKHDITRFLTEAESILVSPP